MRGNFVISSVFPEQEITEVFTRLYQVYSESVNSTKITTENINEWISENDAKILQKYFINIPFVRVEDKDKSDVYFKNNREFNLFLGNIFHAINQKNSPLVKEIDYFSKSLFEKIGNNNLNIKENPQTAGLLFSL